MRRVFTCILFLSVTATFANAQEISVTDVFGGYSYSRINPDFLAESANANGWHTDLAVNLPHIGGFLGVVADFSGHYGKSAGANVSMRSALFGLRFTTRTRKINWFVQSMYGLASMNANRDIFGPEIGRFDSSFAFAPGSGGIEVNLSERVAVRPLQYDLIFTTFGRGGAQSHSRVSTGVNFRLGKQQTR